MGAKRSGAYGKAHYKRRRIPKDQQAVICYAPKVCPDVMRVRMRYTQHNTLASGGVSVYDGLVFRGNSIFDPDFTAVGHQPLGHDQWAQFFRRYRVLSSKMVVKCASDNNAPVAVGIVPLATNTVASNKTDYTEAQYSKFTPLGNSGQHGITTLTHYMSSAKMRGGPPDYVRYNEDLTSTFGANPAQQWYWHVFGFTLDNSSTWDIAMEIEVIYYVEMYDRETLVRS